MLTVTVWVIALKFYEILRKRLLLDPESVTPMLWVCFPTCKTGLVIPKKGYRENQTGWFEALDSVPGTQIAFRRLVVLVSVLPRIELETGGRVLTASLLSLTV